jgi:hypothetical protein
MQAPAAAPRHRVRDTFTDEGGERERARSDEREKKEEAASGFEPLNGGFADLSLNHLGTPPLGAPANTGS